MPRRVEVGFNLTQPIYVLIFTLLIKTDLLFVSYVYSLDSTFYATVSSSVIRRKGKRISNISYLLIHTGVLGEIYAIRGHIPVSGGKKYSFLGKLSVLCFLVTTVLRFALLPYCRQVVQMDKKIAKLCKPFFV